VRITFTGRQYSTVQYCTLYLVLAIKRCVFDAWTSEAEPLIGSRAHFQTDFYCFFTESSSKLYHNVLLLFYQRFSFSYVEYSTVPYSNSFRIQNYIEPFFHLFGLTVQKVQSRHAHHRHRVSNQKQNNPEQTSTFKDEEGQTQPHCT
jgi:hypothetical protein